MLTASRVSLRPTLPTRRVVASARPTQIARGLPTTRRIVCRAAEDAAPDVEAPSDTNVAEAEDTPEDTFYEGSGSDNELLVSCVLGLSLIYAPLTLASIGRRLWFKLKITNKRVIISFNSPVKKEEVQVTYDKIKEARSVQRTFGAWGDLVIFLKNGKTIELVGLDKVDEIKRFINEKAFAKA